MRLSHLVPFLVDDVRTVLVTFDKSSRSYTYKTNLDLSAGDLVIVTTGKSYGVGEIEEIHDVPKLDKGAKYEYGWVVAELNPLLEEHESLKLREREFLDSLKEVKGKTAKVLRAEYGVTKI